MRRRPSQLKTVDILAACPWKGTFRPIDVAEALGYPVGAITGHLDYLVQSGRLAHPERGVYELTPLGRAVRGPDFGAAA